ncbi:MAG TPA: transposase [Clostridiaceae bacterium]|nr:transposase [Clostridiaceae bacterium]
MPRTARKKSSECMYHIMSRSISEVDLFKCDEDKEYYLRLLKRYKEMYHCKIYAYVLMNNHVHIFIDPCGYDISSFMRCLSSAYVAYFNKKYKRHGHLFQGRFASSIVNNDTYCLTLSAYIHNNPKDLPGYACREEEYKYSSYGIYTGFREDTEGIIDVDFILGYFGGDNETARVKYKMFTESMKENGVIKEVDENIMKSYIENEYISGKSYIVRDREPEKVMSKISELMEEEVSELELSLRRKHSRKTSKIRAFATYVLRVLCGYTYKDICKYIGNITISGITSLTNKGFLLIKENMIFRNLFNSLIHGLSVYQ